MAEEVGFEPTRHTHHAASLISSQTPSASWVFLRKINIISALPILQAELPTILDHIYLKSLLVATK